MSNHIFFDAPFNVIALIFAHLPVIILLRYRLVSKAFRDLIDSRYFANMHLHHSMRTGSNRNMLCKTICIHHHEYCPHIECLDVPLHFVDVDTLSRPVPKRPRVWKISTKFFGTCNGIVLLYDINQTSKITLWNPAIRRCIHLTVPRISIPIGCGCHLGLGYDYVNDDYKVVMLVQSDYTAHEFRGEEIVKEIFVYSLKSNSWRRIQDFPYFVRNSSGCPGTYVNGALYWICVEATVDSDIRDLLVAFDLATEEYRVVQLPVYDDTSCKVENIIGSLDGSLCVHSNLLNPHTSSIFDDHVKTGDTWLLVERVGEEDTWTKLVSFDRLSDFPKPLTYSKCGKQLLLEFDMNFFWYDLVKGGVREKFNIRGLPDFYVSDVLVETLVHLDGGGSDDENQRIIEETVVEEKIDKSDEEKIDKSDEEIGTATGSFCRNRISLSDSEESMEILLD